MERSRKFSNSIVAVNDEKARRDYVMENYFRLEEEYKKFKTRYNIYHLVKDSISKILNGQLIHSTKYIMIDRKETKDKLFVFYTKALEDNEISLVEMVEISSILHRSFTEKLTSCS